MWWRYCYVVKWIRSDRQSLSRPVDHYVSQPSSQHVTELVDGYANKFISIWIEDRQSKSDYISV